MDKIVTENLFLLEFLVDSVTLDKKCECDAPPGETCVSFQFLDNAPLDVCEADFNPKRDMKDGDREAVKSGKSCLFSLSPEQAASGTEQFDICVSVTKKMQPGWLPEKVELGGSIISIANLFNELIGSVELSDGSSPTAKTLKDVFDVNDTQGNLIGKISVYIRMSCFGKLIVTQFQMNLDDKSVLFKDKEGKSLYRYKKAGKKKEDGRGEMGKKPNGGRRFNSKCPEVPCDPPAAQAPSGGYDCPFGPCDMSQPQTQIEGGYPQTFSPTSQAMTPCNECGYNPNAVCLPPMGQVAPTPDGNYQEIGASMGGNSLTIRVHKDKGKAEQVDPNAPDDCTCTNTQQQAFAMRPGASPNSPFSFRMGQCGTGAPGAGGTDGNNVVINPPVYTAPDGTQFTEFSDPNKETFILRIGKKSEGVDKKNNLELELQTPKGPPLKPLPKKETVETQWDPQDAGPEDGGGKKAKGGGKGGKGKGKGKKK